MKTSKAEIKQQLEKLQRERTIIATHSAAYEKANRDHEKLEREIERIGDQDYSDDDAIAKLSKAKTKLELCANALPRLEAKVIEARRSFLSTTLYQAGTLASAILKEVAERGNETVTGALVPFSYDRANAARLAAQTDLCQSAWRAVCVYAQITSYLGESADARKVLEAAAKVESVLSESLKDAPDLMSFLVFAPAPSETETAIR